MPDSIIDGTGSGYRAEVTPEHKLSVDGVVESPFHRESEEGKGWNITMPAKTITATGGRILYLSPSEMDTHIFGIWVGWNGGSTNRNRSLFLDIYYNDSVSTTNITAVSIRRATTDEGTLVPGTAYIWDEVGDGMTGGGGGTLIHSFMIGVGMTFIPIDGQLLININKSLGINMKGEEIGEATISLSGYQEDI